MIQAVLKDTMVNISKTTGDGCWVLGVDLKDIMFNTYKTMGDGCWILGVELKNTVFIPLKRLFYSCLGRLPSSTLTCLNILTACQVRIIFMKKNIFLHEEKYFSS